MHSCRREKKNNTVAKQCVYSLYSYIGKSVRSDIVANYVRTFSITAFNVLYLKCYTIVTNVMLRYIYPE